ncbi:hypothetical protein GCM10023340_23610 [Nocardioides marinquilinus]|uniref:Nuclear transport factor 2 family protein n=1 Tax=Nocardioides marinquilinus TaxID=1210400 RepID=A0ABP9PM99_9ACTN
MQPHRPQHPGRPHRPRGVRPALAAALAGAVLATSGCSGGHDLADLDGPQSEPAAASATPDAQPPALPTRATVRSVVGGRLDESTRERLKSQVTGVVDRWIDAAYLGDYPRADFDDAFAVFTANVRDQARGDRRLLTNATVGERVDAVRATRRRLVIDVLADGDRAAGVTARFKLGLQLTGEVERRERVTGDLYLTYQRGAWRVFGYDVERGQV